jgi:phosphate transport system substrate-binding protein
VKIPPAVAICILLLAATNASAQAFQESLHATLPPGLPHYKPARHLAGSLMSVGGDTMATLTKYWIELYGKAHPGVHLEMEAAGPGTGAPALTLGTAQLGQLPRKMLPQEIADFVKKYGYEPFAVRVAGGSYRSPRMTHAICFYVHRDNPIGKLTFSQLDAIFSTTRRRGQKENIVTWGQLGLKGEWADQRITLWGFSQPNGVANFVRERVLNNGEYKPGIKDRIADTGLATMDTIVQGIAADRYAIGYAGFGNATPDVKVVALSENDAGPFYSGSFDDVVTHAYPLSRFVYIYVNRPPGRPLDPLVKEFLNIVLSREGQEAVVREGILLPLPRQALLEERVRIR